MNMKFQKIKKKLIELYHLIWNLKNRNVTQIKFKKLIRNKKIIKIKEEINRN